MEYRNSKRNIWAPIVVAVAVVAGILLGQRLPRPVQYDGRQSFTPPMAGLTTDKLDQVLTLIYGQYVDEPHLDSIEELVIPTILESLDPHSAYIPADELAQVNESIDGHFDGIGVTFNMLNDTVRIITVIGSGPSDRAGIRAGDRILTINDSIVAGRSIPQDSIVGRLRGPRGTEVRLGIERQGVDGLLPITVIRGVIPIHSVDAGFMAGSEVGYVRLSLFSRTSHQEIVEAGARLKAEGMKYFIIDLRGNSGGLLDQAIYIANEFLPADALIVYTEGWASRRNEQFSNGRGVFQDIYPIVLIDEGTASASEIVAGALQDNDRGTIIGRRSFGKGLVQEQIELGDGSALRLTIARYYTPVGRSIQKPYEQGIEAYQNDLRDRFEHSELFSADSIRFADSLKFTTPGGKTLYGGGGIMPDVFVPLDTTAQNPYLVQVVNRNILFQYATRYTDQHREALSAIQTLPELTAYFDADTGMFDGLVRYAAQQGVHPKGDELATARDELTAYLRSFVGRNTPLEGNAAVYYLLPFDPEYREAVSVIE
ncbi:MAG: S41 family peptidase [Rikenellaceae bacterium]|jgi:carboxyl-terminal processing protease|nr:S41 family peptidase [Rikenellaceae bacterium]